MTDAAPRVTFGRGRRLAILLNVAAMGALALVAAGIFLHVTGFTGAKLRFDLTRSNAYTLSPESEAILAALEQPVEIVTIFDRQPIPPDPEQVRIRAMDYVVDLLQEYKVRAGGELSVEHLVPQRDPGRIADLFQQFDVNTYGVVLVRGPQGQRRVLGLEADLAEFDMGLDASGRVTVRPWRLLAYRAEEALTGAIVEVTQEKPRRVYLVGGHGERGPADLGADGAALLVRHLRQDNLQVEPLSLFVERAVPADADAVFVLGPDKPFDEVERAALESYLARGGRLFAAIDPLEDRSLDPLWLALGARYERVVVCFDQGGTVRATDASEVWIGGTAPGSYGTHPLVDPLRAASTVSIVSRSGALAPAPGAENAFTCLFSSHPDAWGDLPKDASTPGDYRFHPQDEARGQRCLAAALEPVDGPYAGARVVLVASDRLVSSVFLAQVQGNAEFVRRVAGWLTGKKRGLELLPRRVDQATIDLRPEEYDRILLYLVGYLPLGALALTVLVWLARRR